MCIPMTKKSFWLYWGDVALIQWGHQCIGALGRCKGFRALEFPAVGVTEGLVSLRVKALRARIWGAMGPPLGVLWAPPWGAVGPPWGAVGTPLGCCGPSLEVLWVPS